MPRNSKTFEKIGVFPISFEDVITTSPEKKLWYTCLAQAIYRSMKGFEEAREWFKADESEGIGSFKWVCHSLNLEKSMPKIKEYALEGKRGAELF